ncbi:amylovoran biosynthesis protein AmsE [Photobacterium phosphoreum]|uniref:glycosyltransferase n=1 Tax=Photobacterium phosphoreum TaxID=659 RepID=UPI000D1737B2|nr:glycosyltransferase [Photobacterium phosphoreum]PSW29342.1 amylovoran biosynthesis protein AmsE [Photobacterium phosphoreum]
MSFSVLISVYKNEKASFFNAALLSIAEQTLLPNQIVIVHDGPLTNELYSCLYKWKLKLPIQEMILEHNVGLGEALNKGLDLCKYDLVARVDTDDINLPTRFEKQIKYMDTHPDVSLISSHISEFDKSCHNITGERRVPLYNELDDVIHIRNPINHMAVMFRKRVILLSGGYKHFPGMEDYYLWVRIYDNGFKIQNIDEVLVLARTGDVMLSRRQGWSYCKMELKFLKMLLQMDSVKHRPKIILVYLLRAFIRLLPVSFLAQIYKKLRY